MDHRLCDFTQVPELAAQVTRLSNLAFGEYEGAMEVGEGWTEWYLARPGTDRGLSQAALADGKLVSQVIVCVQPLQLGGQTLRCGIIDSVATDPEHRQQGLARQLMERAHEAVQDADLDAAVLYTNPEDHPYGFYSRLGYRERTRAMMLIGRRPGESGCGAEPVDAAEHAEGLRNLLNRYYVGHEGFSPLEADLWRWHKLDAPNPPTVVAEMTGSGPITTATFATARLRTATGERHVSVAYDIAADVMNADQMHSLLASAPEEEIALLLDERALELPMVNDLGLKKAVAEVAMVLPFGSAASRALEEHGGPWYMMVESVVGV
ncbi:MAG: GNAT family N-acetyltransferase [candidate division WS1 bacterium]|nr:GNAT family N-acetyltransferase [candidate division WS1 bacterium]